MATKSALSGRVYLSGLMGCTYTSPAAAVPCVIESTKDFLRLSQFSRASTILVVLAPICLCIYFVNANFLLQGNRRVKAVSQHRTFREKVWATNLASLQRGQLE